MEREQRDAPGKAIEASWEAQHLALAFKFGRDPYELRHLHRADLPPHPRPRVYRAFLYACARWLHDRELETTEAFLTAMGATVTRKTIGG